MTPSERLLLTFSKATNPTIKNFGTGIHIVQQLGVPIPDICKLVCRQRIAFAQTILQSARTFLNMAHPDYRTVTSRAYYSMYHALRAVVFYSETGDDHQEHSTLYKHFPKAGVRYEVYMLDLSQFSGRRLKHNLLLLDLTRGHLVLKRTRTVGKVETGDTPRKVAAILRKAPLFDLATLSVTEAAAA